MSASFFRELHDRHVVAGDPDATAIAMIADLGLNARQREALDHLIGDACNVIDRARIRNLEHDVTFRDIDQGRLIDIAAERAALLAETFAVGDGRRVTWGDATVADHEERIAFLEKLRNGLNVTIARHLEAVDKLRQAGARCLNDLTAIEVAA